MKKITEKMATAFKAAQACKVGNSEVRRTDCLIVLYLHGNRIAWRNPDSNFLHVTCAGWNTYTTRERLNGLLSVLSLPFFFRQKKGDCQLVDSKAGIVFTDASNETYLINTSMHKVTPYSNI